MKLLMPYDGEIGADSLIEDMQRAGLSDNANALILCVRESGSRQHPAGSEPKLPGSGESIENLGARIQAHYPKWKLILESLSGPPTDVVLKTCNWWKPELLILSRSGRSRSARLAAGNFWLEVVHQARCSVRVAGGGMPRMEGPPRLLIGCDGSEEADVAVRQVSQRKWPQNTQNTVAHVVCVDETPVPTEGRRSSLNRAIENSLACLGQANVTASGTIVRGDPRQELSREAIDKRADTIFVGAGGLRGGRFLMGSVSTAILTRARCAVEVVRT
jgi:nucleotide-binding universal stress UspA family protein